MLDGSGGGESSITLVAAMGSYTQASVSDLTVTGGLYSGVAVIQGTLQLRDLSIAENNGFGAAAVGSNASLVLEGVEVRDTLSTSSSLPGYGVYLQDGAELTATGCSITGNSAAGLMLRDGTEARLEGVLISNTAPADDEWGVGAVVLEGAHLEAADCTFSENTQAGIWAQGEGAQVTLVETTIQDTQPDGDDARGMALYITEGATLTATSCSLAGNTTAGLYVDDGAVVTMEDSTISGTLPGLDDFAMGAWILDGSTVTLRQCTFEDNDFAGVAAYGEGTYVLLEDTWVQGTEPTADGSAGLGIVAATGASLEMSGGGSLDNHQAGVYVQNGGSSFVIEGAEIAGTEPAEPSRLSGGVLVGLGGSLTCDACDIHDNVLYGVFAAESNEEGQTTVALTNSTIEATLPDPDDPTHQPIGVAVNGASSVALSNVTITGSTEAELSPAMMVQADSSLTATESTFLSSRGVAVTAYDGGSIILDQVSIEGTRHFGDLWSAALYAAGAGTIDISSSTLVDNEGIAMQTEEEGSSISAHEVSVSAQARGGDDTIAIGMAAIDGGVVDATEMVFEDLEGMGFYAWGAGASLSCESCSVADGLFAGGAVGDGASLVLEGADIQEVLDSENIGGGVGVFADSTAGASVNLDLSGSLITGCPLGAIWINGDGSYALESNDLYGGEGDEYGSVMRCGDAMFATGGATTWDGTAGLLIQDNTLQQGRLAGLFLDDATATLDGNTFQDNATDIVVQGDVCDELPEGWEEATTVETCPEYDHPTCSLELALEIVIASQTMADWVGLP